MKQDDKSTLIAAAIIFVVTVLVFFYMPAIMRMAGVYSPWLSAAIAIVAVAAFFAVFWLRGRFRRRD